MSEIDVITAEPAAAQTAVALQVDRISHRYGERLALDAVSFDVHACEIFGLLGPNGGGKTTLFRILSTLIPPGEGTATILGADIRSQPLGVRHRLGVVFQAPSLDKKLRVAENLRHQGALYGLQGADLTRRIDELLSQFRLADRARDVVETLSGGLQRRVEIAKALLHRPRFILLDEPSTGLDPGARIDLWNILERLRSQDGVTILLTTHLMEEAERCDRVAIIDRGRIVALDTPDALRAAIGGDVVSISTRNPETLLKQLELRFGVTPSLLDGQIRIERKEGHQLITQIMEAFPGEIAAVNLGKPTLEDVFIARTGHRLTGES